MQFVLNEAGRPKLQLADGSTVSLKEAGRIIESLRKLEIDIDDATSSLEAAKKPPAKKPKKAKKAKKAKKEKQDAGGGDEGEGGGGGKNTQSRGVGDEAVARNVGYLYDRFIEEGVCPVAKERDHRIYMDEASHTYFIDGVRLNGSTTGSYKKYFEVFDPKSKVDDMYAKRLRDPKWGWRWKQAKYKDPDTGKPMEKHEILNMWKNKGERASSEGTEVHRCIELFYNNELTKEDLLSHPRHAKELRQFLEWHKQTEKWGWVMLRTEWIIWHEASELPGSIDALYGKKNRDGSWDIHMVDWKVSASISDQYDWGGRKKYGNGPCSEVPDSKVHQYMMQQGIYSTILREDYGLHVKSCNLAVFHKTFKEKEYVHWPLTVHWGAVKGVMELRIKDLWRSDATKASNA